jgi:hypothetical protein
MAQFIGTVQGQRGPASRLGGKLSGLRAEVDGAHVGVEVKAYVDDDGEDAIDVKLTSGSYGGYYGRAFRQVCTLRRKDLELDSLSFIMRLINGL